MRETERILNKIKTIKNNIVLELPTGYGKTKLAIEVLKLKKYNNVLIVVPKLSIITTWKNECKKWEYNGNITYSTYVGLHKISNSYDCIVLDECHRITERSFELLESIKTKYIIGLSATINKLKRYYLKSLLFNPEFISISLRDAIEKDVLPDPKVVLMPLILNNTKAYLTYIKNKKIADTVVCTFKNRFKYFKLKKQVHITCTEKEYYQLLSEDIEFYKSSYMRSRNEYIKTAWLKLAKDRLDFLAKLKNQRIKNLLLQLKDKRVVVFCADIKQANELTDNPIHSMNNEALEVLDRFNRKEINHISTCAMLNEGINLVDCPIGIHAVLNASDTLIIQKIGRNLRHKQPEIYLPYFMGTREEELKNKMTENYNKDLISYYGQTTSNNTESSRF